MWTFAKMHANIYEPLIGEWNKTRESQVQLLQLGLPAIERRMLASFSLKRLVLICWKSNAAPACGRLEGLSNQLDLLTDRPTQERGIARGHQYSKFQPWSSRGRIFGLPHDVHPLMPGIARTSLKPRRICKHDQDLGRFCFGSCVLLPATERCQWPATALCTVDVGITRR